MIARTYSTVMQGLKPVKIEIEADATRGIPRLIIIGLASQALNEAKERITTALLNCGIRLKNKKTIINLAPAELKKSTSSLDLAIAMAILNLSRPKIFDWSSTMFFGELSLDGSLKPIKATLPLVLAARELGYQTAIIPKANVMEVQTINGINIVPLQSLQQLLKLLESGSSLPAIKPSLFRRLTPQVSSSDWLEVKGQQQAKRALTIAAAGGHNLLFIGPPGSGKTLLAKSMISLLPPLNETEALAVTQIYSLLGLARDGLIVNRPFRSPHHTITVSGLIGGGPHLMPGEISLAHCGVLFLDECLELNRACLEALREPLDAGQISLVRANGRVSFPAKFNLVAATNPCPCGYHQTQVKTCQCNAYQLSKYRQKLSGPLLDRIEMILHLGSVNIKQLKPSAESKSNFLTLNKQVAAARIRQQTRLAKLGINSNAELSQTQLRQYCQLTTAAQRLLQQAAKHWQLSARSYFKLIKVAQTITDLAEQTNISETSMAEALSFRETF